MKENFSLPIVKHLQDVDDLIQKRDAELVPGQEHIAAELATAIYNRAIENDFKVLLFSVSSKRRARETAELVKLQLEKMTPRLRIVLNIEENLREIDQGDFILPENYESGDVYDGLRIAGRIFSTETFNSQDSSKDNLTYRFGDPYMQSDGSYKYPELEQYFLSPGESYRDILLRFCKQVIKLYENMDRFEGKVDPVVFTHGQLHQIFTNLAEVGRKITDDGFTFETGELARICWGLYNSKPKNTVPFGQLIQVSFESLCTPVVVEKLIAEIKYLESL